MVTGKILICCVRPNPGYGVKLLSGDPRNHRGGEGPKKDGRLQDANHRGPPRLRAGSSIALRPKIGVKSLCLSRDKREEERDQPDHIGRFYKGFGFYGQRTTIHVGTPDGEEDRKKSCSRQRYYTVAGGIRFDTRLLRSAKNGGNAGAAYPAGQEDHRLGN